MKELQENVDEQVGTGPEDTTLASPQRKPLGMKIAPTFIRAGSKVTDTSSTVT